VASIARDGVVEMTPPHDLDINLHDCMSSVYQQYKQQYMNVLMHTL